MKLLNEQGKMFGLINPFDLAVILIIILIGAKVISDYRPQAPRIKERRVTIGLLVRNVPPYVADSLVVGQDLFEDHFDAYLGKIRGIQTEAAELLFTDQGRVILSRSPRNLDIRLVITKQKARIEKNTAESGIYLGKIAARVGTRLRAHTNYTAVLGEITFVRINQ